MNLRLAINSRTPATKPDRWYMLLAVSVAVHVSMLFCPAVTVPPRGAEHRRLALTVVVFLMVPLIWSIFLPFSYRTPNEHMVAFCSLVLSLLCKTVAAIAAAALR